MFKQTYSGLRALAGLEACVPPWDVSVSHNVVEVLPRAVANELWPACAYKGRGEDARRAGGELLRLVRNAAGLDVSSEHEKVIAEDVEGDALDAVLAAVAAASAWQARFECPVSAAMSGEGWIYSAVRAQ